MIALGIHPGTGTVVAMMGAAGSGKSTLAEQIAAVFGAVVISYDQCREEISGDAGDQSVTPEAVAMAHERLNARCANRWGATFIDGVHDRAEHRRNVLDIAGRHGVPAVLIALATPAEVCVRRQADRPLSRQVPEEIIRAQYARVLTSLPDLHAEGWNAVHVLNANHLKNGRTSG